MKYRPRTSSGWTLLEMLIVIVMLAIVGALVYPHAINASTEADDNMHRAQLKHIREQIQLYRIQHGGQIPNLIANWDELTKVTTYKTHPYGPYLSKVPRNHKRSTVFDGNKVEPPTEYGFVYDYRGGAGTGMIYATNGSGIKLRKW